MIPVSTARKVSQSQEDGRRKADCEHLGQRKESGIANPTDPTGSSLALRTCKTSGRKTPKLLFVKTCEERPNGNCPSDFSLLN